MLPAAIVQAADSPEKVLLQLVLIHDHQQGSRNGTQQHAHHHAGQQQCQHGNPAVPGGQADSQEHGADGTYKGKGRHGKHVYGIYPQADGHHSTYRSAAGDAYDARVSQGIAENPLQYRAGGCQPRPHHKAHQGTGGADKHQHSLLLGRDIYILQHRQPQLVAAPGRHLQETQVILTG